MKKLLSYLLFLTIVFVKAQNDNCSGAIPLTVGTDFASGAVNSTNLNATTDGPLPTCNPDAIENVWFKVVVPASGNIKIATGEVSGSLFSESVVTVYSGTCGALTEITCNDQSLSLSSILLSGQTPGATLYISVWKFESFSDNGEFQISAYDPTLPANDNCTQAQPLTVGTDFASGAITSSNSDATTDGVLPSCNSEALENIWFKVTVPPSGNITIETAAASGSLFNDSVLTVYSGNCTTLTEISCNDDKDANNENFFSLISLTGQTPGTTLYISVWKYQSLSDNGEFQISAYDNTALSTHEVSGNKKIIQVYPNPFSKELSISDISKVKGISVTDISGKTVKNIEKPSSSIDLSDLVKGIYFITLKMNDGTLKTTKIIKK